MRIFIYDAASYTFQDPSAAIPKGTIVIQEKKMLVDVK